MNFKVLGSLAEVSAAAWNALTPPDFPCADHAYLSALETSGSVGENTGWAPAHLTAWEGDRLVGAAPTYLKTDSYGEYIFDWGWARAFLANGVPYYPKLVSAIPFTPATGAKLMVAAEADAQAVRDGLVALATEITRQTKASSAHFLFAVPEELPAFQRGEYLVRHSYQYHWINRGYGDFAGFLDAFKNRKRKQIVREREWLSQSEVTIECLEGDALRPEHARAMYAFYSSTIEKMGAIGYLTPQFFETVFREMKHAIVLMWASVGGEPVAAALNYRKGAALFGRYWGSSEHYRNLHFELCYYRGIEYAIAHGLRLFEAGAQGEHKIARGFEPRLTYSAHWIGHPAFRAAIADFVEREKTGIAGLFEETASHLPFRTQSVNS